VLFFDLPDDVALERMLTRAADEGRADDTPDAIGRRLALYHEETEPLVEYYRSRGNVVGIHGDRSENEVFAEIQRALEQARPGNRLSDISHAVQTVTEEAGFSVVRSLVGHGVGRSYHEDPQIPNFGPPGRGPLLAEGMTLAIEPMINAGSAEVYLHDDEWSISTADG
jgi:hypothetical protein